MLTRLGAPRALNTLHQNRLLLSFIFFSPCLKAEIIRGERAVILSAAKDLAWRVARRAICLLAAATTGPRARSARTRQITAAKNSGREIPSASLRTGSSPVAQDDTLLRWPREELRSANIRGPDQDAPVAKLFSLWGRRKVREAGVKILLQRPAPTASSSRCNPFLGQRRGHRR
jgi:hypothetical protein